MRSGRPHFDPGACRGSAARRGAAGRCRETAAFPPRRSAGQEARRRRAPVGSRRSGISSRPPVPRLRLRRPSPTAETRADRRGRSPPDSRRWPRLIMAASSDRQPFLVAVGDFDSRSCARLWRADSATGSRSGTSRGAPAAVRSDRPRRRRIMHAGEQVHVLIRALGTRDLPTTTRSWCSTTSRQRAWLNDRLSRTLRDELGLAYSVGAV